MSQNALISESESTPPNAHLDHGAESAGIAISKGFRETVSFLYQLFADGAGIYLLTGQDGVGKSTALRYAEQHAPDDVVVIIYSFRRIDVDNLSDLLGHTLGVKVPQELPPEARALRYFLKLGTIRSKGKRLILMLDDVQELHSSGAELLKALVNMKDKTGPLITVVLCGNTSLNAFLDTSYRWGIQRLIRKNHEMQGFTQSELPDLVERIRESGAQRIPPVKSSALQTLFRFSAGIPGKAVELIDSSSQIAQKYGYRAISSRMIRGAKYGEFKTWPGLLTQFTVKSALAMSLLLLAPATIFHQSLQQQQADILPEAVVTSSPEPTSAPSPANDIPAEPEIIEAGSPTTLPEPVIASIADDIAPTPSPTTVVEEEPSTIASTEVSLATTASPSALAGEFSFASFSTRIEPVLPEDIGVKTASFNQSIPSNRENVRRLLGESMLIIPSATDQN
ncbi:MAG: AAA family ATPase [Acidiferrobacterales bacterium]|nr:AAA family ATPase [Acidiferrobacterales bacterium]